VSRSETIARLETLLARVRARAGEPRETRQPLAAAAPAVAAVPPPVAAVAPPVRAVAPPVAAVAPPLTAVAPPLAAVVQALAVAPPSVPTDPPPSDEIDAVTIPPPAPPPPPARPTLPLPPPSPAAPPVMRAVMATETDVVVDVELPPEAMGDAVIDVTAEEGLSGEPLDSVERLVAAEPLTGAVVEIPAPESLGEAPADLLAVVEEIEEAPVSSRRPVFPEPEERLADLAFGSEEPSPPRHTPPPESGRLPAAPSPMEVDTDAADAADVTGVREAPPIAPRTHDLVPEATRADLAPHDAVADIVAEAQRFAPSTFAALLDASLAL
jgi:hypothetical protein